VSAVADGGGAVLELTGIARDFNGVRALDGVDLAVAPGRVSCVLGDNGAGKSTLIAIMSGLIRPSAGEYRVDGAPVRFRSPREARARGIATVYQDLAMVPLMPVWRNFFLGSEPRTGPFRALDVRRMRRVADAETRRLGVALPDVDAPAATLSGGQRQVVAIARAVYFGARVLILDEPTAALGVRQSGIVLRYVRAARDAGVAVVLVTHNPHHAHLVGDRFTVLARGRVELDAARAEVDAADLAHHMSGGAELDTLRHELGGAPPAAPGPEGAADAPGGGTAR
jgi:simple sugar transport system ATP-binding protein